MTLESFSRCKDYLLLSYSDGINNHFFKYNLSTETTTEIKLPFTGSAYASCFDTKTNEYLVGITSWARQRALTMSDDITSALNERRVRLAFQPIVHARTGKTAFCEALMRIENVDGTYVMPASVFPTAEKIGLAQMLDHRVLELAVGHLALDTSLTLAVNCSGVTAYHPEWPAQLAAMLDFHPGLAGRLIIEITETCAIVDIEATRQIFADMRKTGVRIAMDDFGAGHTSFRNLRNLHVDILKIDGAFVQNLSRSADDRFFVRTLVDLAGHLGIETVAEWVEDADSARILADWGVTYLQGNYFGAAEIPPAASRDSGLGRMPG